MCELQSCSIAGYTNNYQASVCGVVAHGRCGVAEIQKQVKCKVFMAKIAKVSEIFSIEILKEEQKTGKKLDMNIKRREEEETQRTTTK